MTEITKGAQFLQTFRGKTHARMQESGGNLSLALLDAYVTAREETGQEGYDQALALLHSDRQQSWDLAAALKQVTEKMPSDARLRLRTQADVAEQADRVTETIASKVQGRPAGQYPMGTILEAAAAAALKHGPADRTALTASGHSRVAEDLRHAVSSLAAGYTVLHLAQNFADSFTEELRERLDPESDKACDLATAVMQATLEAVKLHGTSSYNCYLSAVRGDGFLALEAIEEISRVCAESAEQIAAVEAEEEAGAEP